MKKVSKVLGVIVILVAGLVVYIQFGYRKKFNNIPYPDIHASKDSAVIARGKYLVYGPAHCAMCHAGLGMDTLVDKGMELPLAGGFELHIPVGTFRPRNITSDKETGIGNLTDGEIARTLRYNVSHNGEALIAFMPFQELSADDMTAVISYLRTLPPVHHVVPPSEYNFMGKIVKTFVLKPTMPVNEPPKHVQKDSTAEYGKYLAMSVANCHGCHTDRNMKTGEFTGQPFAGGLIFAPSPETSGFGFVSPNLTPDKETGKITEWNEMAFINRIRQGRLYKGSPMPWGPFSRMDETDLKAIYRFLHNVEPVKNVIIKTVYQPTETMPEPKN